MKALVFLAVIIVFSSPVLSIGQVDFTVKENGILSGKIICLDPGHGGTALTDSYRVGPAGEREEWINLRVALLLKELLEEKGAIVPITRKADIQVGLAERAKVARESNARVFLSIHHNATADTGVNFPILYYHGSSEENLASVMLGRHLAKKIRDKLFGSDSPVSLVSDHTIFPGSGASVLRESYGIPGIIAEASFFSNPNEEERLKNRDYNLKEAQAFVEALEDYFMENELPIKEKIQPILLPPFPVLQEAERMNPEALLWHRNYIKALGLMETENLEELSKALDLFTQSAKAFPDSYVAAKCHQYRAEILFKMGVKEKAGIEALRSRIYYQKLD